MKMSADQVHRYSRKIEGWFCPNAAQIIWFLNQVQAENGIKGNIFEIGVHHGKMSMHLGAMLAPDECIGVCDLFGMQEENISGSGDGSLGMFYKHWDRLFQTRDRLRVFSKNSNQLSLQDTTTNCRIFSIDGGHSCQETYDDLQLAVKAILPEGVIVLDDFFEPEFPGVAEGACRFLIENTSIVPLLLVGGRLLLCRQEFYPKYNEAFRGADFERLCVSKRFYIQKQIFFGVEIGIVRQFTAFQRWLLLLKGVFGKQGVVYSIANKTGLLSLYRMLTRPRV